MLKLLLAFLISISAQAAQQGAPTATIAAPGANTAQATVSPGQLVTGCANSTSSGCFSLYGYVSSASAGNFYALYGGPGTAGTYSGPGQAYRVTTAKTAYCFDMTSSCSAANCSIQAVSATAAFNNAASLTGPVYQGGATTAYPLATGATASTPYVLPGVYGFSTGTFAGYQTANGTQTFTVHMDCFEQ